MSWIDEIGKDTYEDFPIVENPEVDEDSWEVKRLGMITGSNFGKLVVKSKDRKSFTLSTNKTAQTLIYKIAWERLLKSGNISNGLGRLNISSREMEHGNDYEGKAIEKYIERTGNKVKSAQEFIRFDEFIGGTPDGFVNDDGLIEVKSPWNGGNHLYSLLENKIYNEDHFYQIQGYLWITDREWCDYITFDPDLIDELQLNVIRVKRDENVINGISLVMEMVKEKIINILNNEKLKR
ncbi:lambda exonuclease family protein [Joostella sp. CR20]|uniref:lambda exonuclease family protein n=1 Tax=Joostella sp. CR20 TaxID=2804312 RepID=UPI00313CCAB2